MEADRPSALEEFSKFAGSAASLVAFAATLCVLLSLSHEMGYYLNIGESYLYLLAPVDYIRQSVFWLPLIALGLLNSLREELRVSKLRELIAVVRGIEPAASDRFLPLSDKFLKLGGRIIFWMIAIPFSLSLPWFDVVIAIVVYYFLNFKLLEYTSKIVDSRIGLFSIIYATLIGLSFMSGMIESGLEVSNIKFTPESTTTFKMLGQKHTLNANVLRYIDRGVLVKKDHSVIFLPWSAIERVSASPNPAHSISDIIKEIFKRNDTNEK